ERQEGDRRHAGEEDDAGLRCDLVGARLDEGVPGRMQDGRQQNQRRDAEGERHGESRSLSEQWLWSASPQLGPGLGTAAKAMPATGGQPRRRPWPSWGDPRGLAQTVAIARIGS